MDLTQDEIVQLAQTAYNSGHKQLAEYYYKLLLQRYGTDTESYIVGRFELAHLYLKKKRYDEAVPMLQEIVEIYDTSVPGALPGDYIKLAKLDLAKVPEAKLAEITARLTAETPSYPFEEEDLSDLEETDEAESDWFDEDYGDDDEESDEDYGAD